MLEDSADTLTRTSQRSNEYDCIWFLEICNFLEKMEWTIIIWDNSMYNRDHKLVIRDKNPVWRWFGKWLWFQQRFMVPNLTAIWHPDCSFISQLPFLNFWVQWIKSEIHGPNNSSGRIWTFAKNLMNVHGLNPKTCFLNVILRKKI